MRSSFVVTLLFGLALAGCGQQETPPPPKAAPPAPTAMPALTASPAPAPPPQTAPPSAAAPAASAQSATADIPTFEGKDEAERLSWALRAYFQDPNRPAIDNFEPLVKARLIKAIPVPPPGKKYVIDMKQCEVRLENK